MAKVPIEIVRIGKSYLKEVEEVVCLLDNIQTEFQISLLRPTEEGKFRLLEFKQAHADELLTKVKKVRNDLKGFHPYIIAVSDTSLLRSDNSTVCGDAYPENGIALFTFNKVVDAVVPTNKVKSYIAYYIARFSFNFLIPQHRSHDELTDCVFDTHVSKADLLNRIKSGGICDTCREKVMNEDYNITTSQFSCLQAMFRKAGELLMSDVETVENKSKKQKIFVGSSLEGIDVARKIQVELSNEFEVVIWNQGIFDKLGVSYIETLEQTVSYFDYGIFVFTPDDKIESRGETKKAARDNVIFELGMFTGKLTRHKAFLVYPQNSDIHILSDFAGITMAGYDTSVTNLQAALGPACDKIRTSIAIG
jgi:predicted nucleotide-binding protein